MDRQQQQTVGKHTGHAERGESGTQSAHSEELQASTAWAQLKALTNKLMEQVCERENLNRAYKRVKANKGAAGADGMRVEQFYEWIKAHKQELITSLLNGSYLPQPVRGVEIDKPGGGMRQLGIPTVVDRLVQQAILQVLEPLLEPGFSTSSYGFRPGRNAHQALHKAEQYVATGRNIVVDIDLEKFFDRVNHDVLMSRLARRIGDKRLLSIIRRFLNAGMMQNGVCVERYEGMPQGGPLSPLMSNLLLDDLDKELEKRGHCFCRYADDCNIYVRTMAAGERVMASLTQFLEQNLKLRVNRDKSAVAHIQERKFLGYRLLHAGQLALAPKSLQRIKDKIRLITKRSRGVSLKQVIDELNSSLSGGVTYFRYAQCRTHLQRLDQWIRHRLRALRLKQRKRSKSIANFLHSLGIARWQAWRVAGSGKGWWRLANSPQLKQAMNIDWFNQLGLINLVSRFDSLNR